MKKAVLSLSLIFTFAVYIFYVHTTGTAAPVVFVPVTNQVNTVSSRPQSSKTTQTSTPASSLSPNPKPVVGFGKYKNGTYVGNVADAYYGNVQVKAIISGGKIVDVQFLDYPQDRQNSVRINSYAMPRLISEAISVQDSNVNTISGASFTSAAYRESLSSALSQART